MQAAPSAYELHVVSVGRSRDLRQGKCMVRSHARTDAEPHAQRRQRCEPTNYELGTRPPMPRASYGRLTAAQAQVIRANSHFP